MDPPKAPPSTGLESTERMQELVDHLKEYEKQNSCDTSRVTQSMITRGEDEMKPNAKNTLKHPIEEEGLEVRLKRQKLQVGNSRRPGVEERIRILKQKQRARAEKEASQDAKIASLEAMVSELEDSMFMLKLASPGYKQMRGRFISTFKRDKFQTSTPLDQAIIAGDVSAHDGDARADALLYDGVAPRSDAWAFEELYGMHPFDVMQITHEETIRILNEHATVRLSTERKGNPEFYARYARFIKEYKRLGHHIDYLLETPVASPTRAAYDAVNNCPLYEEDI